MRALLATLVALALWIPALGGLWSVVPPAAAAGPQPVSSDAETDPVTHAGDAIDDPAVWVHPTDPARSLVLGNDKLGGLETYDLAGHLVQRLTAATQFWGNVDVVQGVSVGGVAHDLVGVVQGGGVRFYAVDPSTRLLSPITEGSAPVGASGEGFCLYDSPATHRVYGFVITIEGRLTQFELLDADHDGLLESRTVRSFEVGSEAEGCVADDDTGALYVSEENVALWRYSAEPGGGTTRTAVDTLTSTGGHLVNDIEGVTLVDEPDGSGYVVVSAQAGADADSFFAVYDRGPGNAFVKTFRSTAGSASDDCDHTDGITAVTAGLGPAYPRGVFVCQDGTNDLPGRSGNQDLKLTRLERVVDLDGPSVPPAPGSGVSFVAASSTDLNATTFEVRTPTATRAGDLLLLLAAQGSPTPLTGPGAGWTQAGRVVDGAQVATVWQRVATAADAGATVRLASGATYTKAAVTLAAYRGADRVAPVAAIAGVAESASTAAHRTPAVAGPAGATRVSFWSDRNSATTRWAAPGGEQVRSTTTGSGGGRVGVLLTDPGTAVPGSGTTGGLTATADAPAGDATAWTILLRPAGSAAPPATVEVVGTSAVDANATSSAVRVPAATEDGDALLLFASQGSATALTGPGAGWSEVGKVVDGAHVTTAWSRVARASDAGATVRVSTGTTYTKVAVVLAAYRGTDPADPVAAFRGAAEGAAGRSHTSPTLAAAAGQLRVTYWSDRNSATGAWVTPAGERVRALVTGTGGGRVSAVLTDPAAVEPAARATGALTATADAPSSTATMWTLLLRPRR